MEVFEIKQELEKYNNRFRQMEDVLALPKKQEQIAELEKATMAEDFWQDNKTAQKTMSKLNELKKTTEDFQALKNQLSQLTADFTELKDVFDQDMEELFMLEYRQLQTSFAELEIRMLLSGPYDHYDCILEIHPGAGGTESQDWAEMLYRMYSRFAARRGYKLTILDYQDGDTAGIKSVSCLISGNLAYGYLKGEKGVHRLVRISPFDSSGRRHTSFAGVEVFPQLEDEVGVEIKTEDLVIDTRRASGAGGQHVNTTDSAVKIIHVPTGITVSCQSERSQLSNKEQAMNILKSRLQQHLLEEQQAKIDNIKGEQKANEWGSQIRNYVFCPYTQVKDVRTGYEESNVDKVMDGEIDEFIYRYLHWQGK